jgi:hypothetical protein
VVSVAQVVAAGLASAVAAFIASKFGVTGTLLGAALTAMVVTGGLAILNSYLENLTAGVRTLEGRRPELRQDFVSRMGATEVLLRMLARSCCPYNGLITHLCASLFLAVRVTTLKS